MKKFAALFMTVVMLLALIGCGNDMDKFVGVWSGESVGGTELDVDSEFLSGFAEALAGMVASSMRLELKADGTGSIFAFGKDEQFTWTASGDNLTIKLPSSEMKPEYKDGKIIIKSEDSDSSIVFSRADQKSGEANTAAEPATEKPTEAPTATPEPVDLTLDDNDWKAVFHVLKEKWEATEGTSHVKVDFSISTDKKTVCILITDGIDPASSDAELIEFARNIGNVVNNWATIFNENIKEVEDVRKEIGNLYDYYNLKVTYKDKFIQKDFFMEAGSGKVEFQSEKELMELTTGQKNALKKAKSYLSFSEFSKSGLTNQLQYAGFTEEEVAFAVENCGADWMEQADKKAKSYLSMTGFSKEGLKRQLKFEGFTDEEIEYALKKNGY
ncbi:MAG: Ltp family lipoprotein [Clostridiales bacterium]|nr:Ltp family lipoprotein [Clostridiales bacterium]